jgi:hypothetical protein
MPSTTGINARLTATTPRVAIAKLGERDPDRLRDDALLYRRRVSLNSQGMASGSTARENATPGSSIREGLIAIVSQDSFERSAKSPFQPARSFCQWPDHFPPVYKQSYRQFGPNRSPRDRMLLAAAEPRLPGHRI